MKKFSSLILFILSLLSVSAADGPPPWYGAQIWKNTNSLADWRAFFTNTIDLGLAPYNIVGDGVTDYGPTIEKALTNAANGTIINFPATTGTNSIVTLRNIIIGAFKNNDQDKAVILRAHPNGSWLDGRAPFSAFGNTITIRGVAENGTTAITSGATSNSATVVVASAAGISVGSYIWIKQEYDPAQLSPEDPGASGDLTNTQGMMGQVTNVSGLNISFEPPLVETLNNSPTLQVCSPRDFVGIENLKVTTTNTDTASQAIQTYRAAKVWVSGCTITNFPHFGIAIQRTFGAILESNYVGLATTSASQIYSIYVGDFSAGVRVENNIVDQASSGLVFQSGAKQSAALYNYFPRTYPASFYPGNFMSGAVNLHGGNDHFILVEGNIGCAYLSDDVWNVNRMIVVFRNWWTSHDPALSWPGETSNAVKSIEIMFTNRLQWAAQNITGLPQDFGTSWPLGYPSTAKVLNGAQLDATVTNSTNLRFVNNYNFRDNNTVSYNSDTYISPPASLFYTAKPSYFSSGMAWPLLGPDVSTKTNYNPAVYRYLGISPPTSSQFSPNTNRVQFIRRVYNYFFQR